jgi:hypothetical protein
VTKARLIYLLLMAAMFALLLAKGVPFGGSDGGQFL